MVSRDPGAGARSSGRAGQRGDQPYVVAVDAGGTHTRVGCFGLDGTRLAGARGGGGSPAHNHDGPDNVRGAVVSALRDGDLDPDDAVGVAAGIASIGRAGSNQASDGDDTWADSLLEQQLPGCPRSVVNDAVVAHRGALGGGAGVVVVAGTGSMVLAVTAEGQEVESGQFEHYAGAARHVASHVVHGILTGADRPPDAPLVAAVLAHWGVPDVPALRRATLQTSGGDRTTTTRRYGALAPSVTAHADTSPLGDAALRTLARRTATGVLLLAPLVGRAPVAVALVGGLGGSAAFARRVGDALDVPGATPTRLVPAALDPLGGAALLALEVAGVATSAAVVQRLAAGGTAAG